MPIEHISDTARWVAVYRAMETERPDALFRDRWARRLAGERGEQIVRNLPRGRSSAWAMIVRTAVFDELIQRLVEREGVDLVLNLAAGLDTRPYRLPLPAALRWVDVDLPALLAYKGEVLAEDRPVCRYEAVPLDLTDLDARRALFARLGQEGRRVLVIAEGLLVYLSPEQVGQLANDLHAQPSFRWWLIDLASPFVLRWMQRSYGATVRAEGVAPMQFGPAEGADFFRPYGWRAAEYRSFVQEARRLKREMRFMWLWRFLNRFAPPARREEFRRASGAALLARA